MSQALLSYGITSYISEGVLILPFQSDFYKEVIDALQTDILSKLRNNTEIRGLIVDVSNITIIDLFDMKLLEETLKMAEMLGATAYLTGLQPQVTLALVDLGYDPVDLRTELTIEKAMSRINQVLSESLPDDSQVITDDEIVENDN